MSKKSQMGIVHWVFTGLVSAMMLFSAVMYLSRSPEVAQGFQKLGYPMYFVQLLAVAKILGAAALLIKRFPRVTEWAYAGLTFTFLGAAVSHYAAGDEAAKIVAPLIALTFLAASLKTWPRRVTIAA